MPCPLDTCVSFFRADNWLVDKGDDEAESQGLSSFGKVRGKGYSPQRMGQSVTPQWTLVSSVAWS